jgi:HlyD family secretion protein
MKKTIIAIGLVVVVAVVFGSIRRSGGHEAINYRLVTIEQGDIESLVSATGTLDAVTTVQVGTQVSGIINEICVDFNDPVKQDQVIARIDTTLLASAVAGANAQLARSHAELKQAEREYQRISALLAEGLVSDSEFNTAQYGLDVAKANVQAAEVDLGRARLNLQYATITSPIDGTVVSRSVEVGQTVQSSFSAPELFLIAGDLAQMQILVSVDESDVGQIAKDQVARFTVQAYPDDTFEGTVRQMRLQSATTENVVNYTAVVDVANPDGRLLPGMTATVDFLVETAADVLYVANASLRYRPDQETMTAAFERMRETRRAAAGENNSSRPILNNSGTPPDNRGMLWVIDDSGELAVVPVLTGISDGSNTVVTGRELAAGLQIVAGVSSSAASTDNSSSPFQQQNSARKMGPPAPGGF